MRSGLFVIPVGLLMATGCGSYWELPGGGIGQCIPKPHYFDGDGDGWGTESADKPVQQLCEADVETQYTSRNGRDCDDSDENTTGRVGATCPAELVVGDADWVGFVGTSSEFVAVLAPSLTEWPEVAASACASWGGWSAEGEPMGWLATFDSVNQLASVQTAIQGALSADADADYAGFIGISSADGSTWTWEDDSALALADIPACTGADLPSPERFFEEQNLAIVYTGEGANPWCLGTPGDASDYEHASVPDVGLSPVIYDPAFGHFICERPLADPANYQAPPQTSSDEG